MFVAVRAMAPVAGMPPKSGDSDVRHALGDEFHVRPVFAAGHTVGDDRREQRLDAGQQRDRDRRRDQRGEHAPVDMR